MADYSPQPGELRHSEVKESLLLGGGQYPLSISII